MPHPSGRGPRVRAISNLLVPASAPYVASMRLDGYPRSSLFGCPFVGPGSMQVAGAVVSVRSWSSVQDECVGTWRRGTERARRRGYQRRASLERVVSIAGRRDRRVCKRSMSGRGRISRSGIVHRKAIGAIPRSDPRASSIGSIVGSHPGPGLPSQVERLDGNRCRRHARTVPDDRVTRFLSGDPAMEGARCRAPSGPVRHPMPRRAGHSPAAASP